jgi:hypothetical protein
LEDRGRWRSEVKLLSGDGMLEPENLCVEKLVRVILELVPDDFRQFLQMR